MNLITEVDILDEAKENFLVYAEEVLTDRAIPSAEDGLLSAQRKILWTMEDHLGMNHKSKTKKCNALVGSTLSTSYYHGDASCYGVLCKMSQPYLMRYPLIIGQGSLGTQENNDMVSSSRYTEAKPSSYADLMMTDFKKNVVPLKETYNNEYYEPIILPGLFPNALCNGRQAIGISLSHNSAPMNLTEVCNGIIAYIKNNSISLEEMMNYIQGPDFPLGGTVVNKNDIYHAFRTGHSNVSLKIRGDYEIKDNKIIFTTIPYRTYRNKIREQITKNIDVFETLLEDFTDESSVGQNRLIFQVKKGISIPKVVDKLFALTDLQTSLSYNMNFIVNGTPKLCSLLDLVQAYVKHQNNVLVKAAEYDLDKAQKRKHILDGLIIATKDIDKAIELIKTSNDKSEAANKLIQYFSITAEQADAILEMKLSRLTKLNRDELLKEIEEKKLIIEKCIKIINDTTFRNLTLIEQIEKMRDTYGDERRTKLIQLDEKLEEEPNIPLQECVVVLTKKGTIKRIPSNNYSPQHRTGVGIKTQEDITDKVVRTNTTDLLMVFTDKGKMYRLLVNDIPEGTNKSKGVYINNLIQLSPDENPQIIYSAYEDNKAKFITFITKKGTVKKTLLSEYTSTKRKSGIDSIALREGDGLAAVMLTTDELITIVSKEGMATTLKSIEIQPSGRRTVGVKGIQLNKDDEVLSAVVIKSTASNLALVTKDRHCKRIKLSEIPAQNRGGKGLCISKVPIADICLVKENDDVLITGSNASICIPANEIPLLGRGSAGNIVLKEGIITNLVKI